MRKNGFIIFFIVTLLSCKSLQNKDSDIRVVDKYLLYFNYTTQEICLLNLETNSIDKAYKIEFDVLEGGAINDLGFSYQWFYKENTPYVYLMEKSHGITKIYKISIVNFDIIEIFRANSYYFNLFVDNNNLYLMNFTEFSNGKSNMEQNYIVLYNFLNRDEKIINFNKLLPENEQVYAPNFFINEGRIIFIGYKHIAFKTLFIYDMVKNTVNILDEPVDNFSIVNNTILYTKENAELIHDGFNTIVKYYNSYFSVYNLENKTYKILSYQKDVAYHAFLIIDEDTFVYKELQKSETDIFDINSLSPTNKLGGNFYIANINRNKRKLLFSTRDDLILLGVINKSL
jgi:hypothetical protein